VTSSSETFLLPVNLPPFEAILFISTYMYTQTNVKEMLVLDEKGRKRWRVHYIQENASCLGWDESLLNKQ
jgi:hypothetical protein